MGCPWSRAPAPRDHPHPNLPRSQMRTAGCCPCWSACESCSCHSSCCAMCQRDPGCPSSSHRTPTSSLSCCFSPCQMVIWCPSPCAWRPGPGGWGGAVRRARELGGGLLCEGGQPERVRLLASPALALSRPHWCHLSDQVLTAELALGQEPGGGRGWKGSCLTE